MIKKKINNCLVELFDEYFTLVDISYLDDIKKGATRLENTNNILSTELYKFIKIRDNHVSLRYI